MLYCPSHCQLLPGILPAVVQSCAYHAQSILHIVLSLSSGDLETVKVRVFPYQEQQMTLTSCQCIAMCKEGILSDILEQFLAIGLSVILTGTDFQC